jgi:hypothetical protein
VGVPRQTVPEDVRRRIEAIQREPRAWLQEAERLIDAADLVGSRFQSELQQIFALSPAFPEGVQVDLARLGAPALLLIGYAIEVLAKGLIVADDPEAGNVGSKWMTKHVSAELLEAAGVQLGPGEPALVEKLYHCVKWMGRYPTPTPLDGHEFDKAQAAAGHWMFGPGAIGTNDYLKARELFDRMKASLEAATASKDAAAAKPTDSRDN